MPLTYRSVKGSKLTSAEADGNITNLDGRITDLEDNPPEPRSIDSTSAAGEVMTITYTDATTDTVNLPKVEYHDRGAWAPLTLFAKYDTFPEEGTLYEVLYPHTSAATFDPGANDGMGHDYYRGIFSNPDNLTDLADVTITSPSIGAGLVWNGSIWIDGVPVTDAAGVTYFASTDGSLASTTVLTAIEELEGRVSTVASEVSGLTADISGLNALDIAFTPTTDSALTSGNVGAALEEIEALVGADLSAYAPLASPVFTGNPLAPTPSPGDNDTSIATTAFVKAAIDVVLGGVSSSFDTLSEIATELATKLALVDVVGKQTIWIPAAAMVSRTTNGPASGTAEMSSNKNMVKTLDFDATTQEFAQFDVAMPKSWNNGTVTFQPFWSHAATVTNFGVVFGLDAVAISDNETLDVAFGTAQTSTDTGGTTDKLYIGAESSAITIAGTPATGDMVQFRIHRDPANGSDTLAIDARLTGVKLFFTTNAATDA